jgi:hypothetical protein
MVSSPGTNIIHELEESKHKGPSSEHKPPSSEHSNLPTVRRSLFAGMADKVGELGATVLASSVPHEPPVTKGDLVRVEGRSGWWPVDLVLDTGRVMVDDGAGNIGPYNVIEFVSRKGGGTPAAPPPAPPPKSAYLHRLQDVASHIPTLVNEVQSIFELHYPDEESFDGSNVHIEGCVIARRDFDCRREAMAVLVTQAEELAKALDADDQHTDATEPLKERIRTASILTTEEIEALKHGPERLEDIINEDDAGDPKWDGDRWKTEQRDNARATETTARALAAQVAQLRVDVKHGVNSVTHDRLHHSLMKAEKHLTRAAEVATTAALKFPPPAVTP